MEIFPILSTLILVATLAMLVDAGSLVWVYRDAERWGRSGPLVALLVAVAVWPLGLLVSWMIRPPRPEALGGG